MPCLMQPYQLHWEWCGGVKLSNANTSGFLTWRYQTFMTAFPSAKLLTVLTLKLATKKEHSGTSDWKGYMMPSLFIVNVQYAFHSHHFTHCRHGFSGGRRAQGRKEDVSCHRRTHKTWPMDLPWQQPWPLMGCQETSLLFTLITMETA